MPDDALQKASLAYRNAHAAIWAGDVPEKYTRMLPYVSGRSRVLELGSAEGVLSLLMSRERAVDHVIALELRPVRHTEGLALRNRWGELGYDISRIEMVCGDIRQRTDLLQSVDTMIAVRSIYYLRDDAVPVLQKAFPTISKVVLCGNRGRQYNYQTDPLSETGRFNFLSSIEGMRHVLTQAGYRVDHVETSGDPIVVGCH